MNLRTVGVVGNNGDLGRKLYGQVGYYLREAHGFDVSGIEPYPTGAVDPSITLTSGMELTQHSDIYSLAAASSILHWCAPVDAVLKVDPAILGDKDLYLHSSTMDESMKAASEMQQRSYRPRISVVHLFMNESRTAVVADESWDSEASAAHMKEIGFSPQIMPAKEHDIIVSETQAPLAVLWKLLAEKLAEYHSRGLLTPSGEEFRAVLLNRKSRLSDATFDSIRNNPEVPVLLKSMQEALEGQQRTIY